MSRKVPTHPSARGNAPLSVTREPEAAATSV